MREGILVLEYYYYKLLVAASKFVQIYANLTGYTLNYMVHLQIENSRL